MLSPIGLPSSSTHAYALKEEVLKSETQSGECLVIVKVPFHYNGSLSISFRKKIRVC